MPNIAEVLLVLNENLKCFQPCEVTAIDGGSDCNDVAEPKSSIFTFPIKIPLIRFKLISKQIISANLVSMNTDSNTAICAIRLLR